MNQEKPGIKISKAAVVGILAMAATLVTRFGDRYTSATQRPQDLASVVDFCEEMNDELDKGKEFSLMRTGMALKNMELGEAFSDARNYFRNLTRTPSTSPVMVLRSTSGDEMARLQIITYEYFDKDGEVSSIHVQSGPFSTVRWLENNGSPAFTDPDDCRSHNISDTKILIQSFDPKAGFISIEFGSDAKSYTINYPSGEKQTFAIDPVSNFEITNLLRFDKTTGDLMPGELDGVSVDCIIFDDVTHEGSRHDGWSQRTTGEVRARMEMESSTPQRAR